MEEPYCFLWLCLVAPGEGSLQYPTLRVFLGYDVGVGAELSAPPPQRFRPLT